MSDFYDDEDDNGSDLIKELRKQRDLFKKERDVLQKELSETRGQVRQRTLVESLEARGLSPKIAEAGLIPADVENVDAWLDTYGELFGGKKESQDEAATGDGGAAVDTAGDIAQQSEVESQGSDDSGMLSKIEGASKDELLKLISGA